MDTAARDSHAQSAVFKPEGCLVLILEDTAEAALAKAALHDAGFVEGDLRIYSSDQILADRDRYLAQRSVTQQVGALTDDRGTIELYFGYAREGRAALWVRVPDRSDANRALRHLADHEVLHLRYYGHYSQEDIHLR
jgi:hypothetical protein